MVVRCETESSYLKTVQQIPCNLSVPVQNMRLALYTFRGLWFPSHTQRTQDNNELCKWLLTVVTICKHVFSL